MLFQPHNQYWQSLREPRNLVDIALVFLLVYSLLRAIRGTRAAPMAAGLVALALLYWAAVRFDLATLESILRLSPFVVSVAIVVLFQNEIRDRKSTRPELQSRQYLVCRLLLEKKTNFHCFIYKLTHNNTSSQST